jgi:hypothetical protein
MKIALIILAGVVLAVVVIVVIGLLLPERHVVSRSASFRATPEALYALITGPQQWRPDVVSSETLPDTNGKELVRETTSDGRSITYEILDRRPTSSLKRRIATPNLPYSGTWTFSIQPRSGSTVVSITEDGDVYNPIFRFVSRFILGQTHTIDTYLRALGQATGQQIELSGS